MCPQYTLPLSTDDVWDVPAVTDGSVTRATLATGTLPSSNVITRTFTYGKVNMNPLALEIGPITANSDKGRLGIDINVEHSTYFMLYVREAGDTTNTGTIDIWYTGASDAGHHPASATAHPHADAWGGQSRAAVRRPGRRRAWTPAKLGARCLVGSAPTSVRPSLPASLRGRTRAAMAARRT